MVTLRDPSYGGTDEALLARVRETYIEKAPQMPVSIQAEFLTGKPARVVFQLGKLKAAAEGEIVEKAQKKPVTPENVQKQLGKLGDSIFRGERMEVTVSPDAFYPLKQMNELRRTAVKLLEEALLKQNGYSGQRKAMQEFSTDDHTNHAAAANFHKNIPEQLPEQLAVSVRTIEQLAGAVETGRPIAKIYLDGDLLFQDSERILSVCRNLSEKSSLILSMPYILRSDDTFYLDTVYRLIQENPFLFKGIQVRSLEGLGFVLEKCSGKAAYGNVIYCDAGVYVWNSKALRELERLGNIAGFCMPYELNSAEQHLLLRELRKAAPGSISCEKVIYGRLPMMLTANCVAKTAGTCQKGRKEQTVFLTDRYRKKFPVALNCVHCMNVIYNSVPLSLHGELHKWKGECGFRLDFTLEDKRETAEIIEYFYSALCEKGINAAEKDLPFTEYTTGHEKRGVL